MVICGAGCVAAKAAGRRSNGCTGAARFVVNVNFIAY